MEPEVQPCLGLYFETESVPQGGGRKGNGILQTDAKPVRCRGQRSEYTKLDWIHWTASITHNKDDFKALIAPVVRFLNETPDRMPMTDWYWTHNARQRGFRARPVVGGVFIQLMQDQNIWSKWVAKADSMTGTWSAIPNPPKIIEVVETSMTSPKQWYYVFEQPEQNWFAVDFDPAAAGWRKGPGGFGTRGTPGAAVRTQWNTSDIWLRREFELARLGPTRTCTSTDEDRNSTSSTV